MTFYEFFCGGGMARAGLGPEWTCLFANDIDRGKAAAYAANWGADRLIVGDVAKTDDSRPTRRRQPRLGVFPVPGLVTRRRSRRARRRAFRLVLAVL